jgi:hypothetical protein
MVHTKRKRQLPLIVALAVLLLGVITTMTSAAETSETVSTAETTVAAAVPDEVNFPNNEIAIAENIWEKFAYERQWDGSWYPHYLGISTFTPDDTPELDWYFPYFIDFCKQTDLTAYQAKGEFTVYKLVVTDFEKYYLANCPYDEIYVGGKVAYMKDKSLGKYYFVKNGKEWQYGFSKDSIVKEGGILPEIKGTVPILADKPFDPYKTPDVVTTEATTTTVAPMQSATYETSAITTAKTAENEIKSTLNTVEKILIAVVSIFGLVIAVFGIFNLIKIKERNKK